MPPKTQDELLSEHGRYRYVTALRFLTVRLLNHACSLDLEDLTALYDEDKLAFEIYDAMIWKRSEERLL